MLFIIFLIILIYLTYNANIKLTRYFKYLRPRKEFSLDEVKSTMTKLKVSGNIISFKKEMDKELEHGCINPKTNLTFDDPILTAKIVIAHIK